MIKLVAHRLLLMIPTLLGVVFIAMLLTELSPTDPARVLAGENAPPERIEMIRRELHLDQSLLERYGRYVWGMLHGDLGESPSGVSVADEIWKALPLTLWLSGLAVIFAVVIGVAGGTTAALRHGRLADRAVTAVASVVQAIPPFVVGLGLVILLAVDRRWLPPGGYVPLTEDPWEWFRHLFLPALTLALPIAALLARTTRAALLDTLDQGYIRALRAKGLREELVIGKHAAKNAATPVVTVLGLTLGTLIGGAVIVETIYALPGFGALAADSVLRRDLPVSQGVVVVGALFVLASNLVVDLCYGYLNPKVRT